MIMLKPVMAREKRSQFNVFTPVTSLSSSEKKKYGIFSLDLSHNLFLLFSWSQRVSSYFLL